MKADVHCSIEKIFSKHSLLQFNCSTHAISPVRGENKHVLLKLKFIKNASGSSSSSSKRTLCSKRNRKVLWGYFGLFTFITNRHYDDGHGKKRRRRRRYYLFSRCVSLDFSFPRRSTIALSIANYFKHSSCFAKWETTKCNGRRRNRLGEAHEFYIVRRMRWKGKLPFWRRWNWKISWHLIEINGQTFNICDHMPPRKSFDPHTHSHIRSNMLRQLYQNAIVSRVCCCVCEISVLLLVHITMDNGCW